jgi:hypothetical protein
MRYMVSGRPQIGGRDSVSRGGQHWPRSGTLVEVVDSEEDPPAEPGAKAGAAKRIGKRTWEALKQDKILISVTPEGEFAKDDLALREENTLLKARVAELEAKLAELEGGASKAAPAAPGPDGDADETAGGASKKSHARR